jgi:hypothetical protein
MESTHPTHVAKNNRSREGGMNQHRTLSDGSTAGSREIARVLPVSNLPSLAFNTSTFFIRNTIHAFLALKFQTKN